MAADIKPALVRQYLDTVQLSAYDTNRHTLRTVRETFANHGHDTGGVEVQIASLTERVRYMTTHLQTHHKDNASRRGLVAMLERRKKLLKYLRRTDGDSYGETLYRLGRLRDRLTLFQSWDVFALEAELKSFAESEEVGFGKIGPPVRTALTAGSTSPDIARTLSALGRDESLGRLDDALQQTK